MLYNEPSAAQQKERKGEHKHTHTQNTTEPFFFPKSNSIVFGHVNFVFFFCPPFHFKTDGQQKKMKIIVAHM